MIAVSVAIYEIFTNQLKCQKVNLGNEGQGKKKEKQDLCQLTAND